MCSERSPVIMQVENLIEAELEDVDSRQVLLLLPRREVNSPYDKLEILSKLTEIVGGEEIVGLGTLKTPFNWCILTKTAEATGKLIKTRYIQVQEKTGTLKRPGVKEANIKLKWLPFNVANSQIVEYLKDFGQVIELRWERFTEAALQNKFSGTRKIVLQLKDGVTAEDLPNVAEIGGHEALFVVKGRTPICIAYNDAGCVIKNCPSTSRDISFEKNEEMTEISNETLLEEMTFTQQTTEGELVRPSKRICMQLTTPRKDVAVPSEESDEITTEEIITVCGKASELLPAETGPLLVKGEIPMETIVSPMGDNGNAVKRKLPDSSGKSYRDSGAEFNGNGESSSPAFLPPTPGKDFQKKGTDGRPDLSDNDSICFGISLDRSAETGPLSVKCEIPIATTVSPMGDNGNTAKRKLPDSSGKLRSDGGAEIKGNGESSSPSFFSPTPGKVDLQKKGTDGRRDPSDNDSICSGLSLERSPDACHIEDWIIKLRKARREAEEQLDFMNPNTRGKVWAVLETLTEEKAKDVAFFFEKGTLSRQFRTASIRGIIKELELSFYKVSKMNKKIKTGNWLQRRSAGKNSSV